MLDWCDELNRLRYQVIAARHPGAPDSELLALWTEQSYRGAVPDALLERALAAIRAGGASAATADPLQSSHG
jgi:hypothetical protein